MTELQLCIGEWVGCPYKIAVLTGGKTGNGYDYAIVYCNSKPLYRYKKEGSETIMSEDPYEKMKRYLCDLVDVAKKHKLAPSILVEVMTLESMCSMGMLHFGKEVMNDAFEASKKHGFYVDERIDEILSRFNKVKKNIEKEAK